MEEINTKGGEDNTRTWKKWTLSGICGFAAVTVGILAKSWVVCPSNEILVVSGKVKGERFAKVSRGGVFVFPVFQEHSFIRVSLKPIQIGIELNALCEEGIRTFVNSVFTVAVSTKEDIMQNAAMRLLTLSRDDLQLQGWIL